MWVSPFTSCIRVLSQVVERRASMYRNARVSMELVCLGLFWFTIGVTSAQTTSTAECVSKIRTEYTFMKCYTEFQDFVNNTGGVGGPGGIRFFCRPEFSSKTKCLQAYAYLCPQLFPAINLPPFEEIQQMCNSTRLTPSYCRNKMFSCFEGAGFRPESIVHGLTPFSHFQSQIGVVCSPRFSVSTRCFDLFLDECRGILHHDLETAGIEDMSTLKHFSHAGCDMVPSDFSTNECVRNHIDSQEFMLCYQNVFTTHGQKSCSSYFAGKDCLRQNVGEPCGHTYSQVFYDTTHLFIKDVPTGCEPEETKIAQQTSYELGETPDGGFKPPPTKIAPSNEEKSPADNGGKTIHGHCFFLTFVFHIFLSLR